MTWEVLAFVGSGLMVSIVVSLVLGRLLRRAHPPPSADDETGDGTRSPVASNQRRVSRPED